MSKDTEFKETAEQAAEREAYHLKFLEDQMCFKLRDLFANMLRCSRSYQGGKPYNLFAQAVEFAQAVIAYEEAGCTGTDEKLHDAIYIPERPYLDYGMADILGGSAQVMASILLHQMSHRAAGESEIVRGINARNRPREYPKFTVLREDRK